MRFVALLVAAIVAVVAGIFALQLSRKTQDVAVEKAAGAQQGPAVTTVEVLVARQPVEVGTILEEAMIDKQPWPSHLVLDGFIVAGSADSNLVGRVARASFQVNEPITRSKVANPNDPSFLAANLPEGMRAITIATDAISGVAGYIFPGDRIDIVMTHNIPTDLRNRAQRVFRPNEKPDVSEVLVADVRVLAVNVRQPSGREASSSTPSSITVAVTEKDAQTIRLAEKVGSISLALRPLRDDGESAPAPVQLPSLTQINNSTGSGFGGVRIIRGTSESGGGVVTRDVTADLDPTSPLASPTVSMPAQ
jgi:pilus assembly protein CpaB